MRSSPLLLCFALLVPTPARAATPPADAPVKMDIGGAKMKLFTDGKKHYVAADEGLTDTLLFYGDGKSFWQQRVGSGGGQKDEADHWTQRDLTFWEPRVKTRAESSFDLRDGKYTVTCAERNTELRPVSDSDAQALLKKATFYKPLWTHRAYALARDNTGKYYFVDKQREPEDSKSFRLYAGPKGNLKPLKMTNVVSDSEGDIFSTRTGELRLVLNKSEYQWVEGEAQKKLLPVPVEDNHVLIYTDLGVYTGQPLGTPCDDL